MLFVLLLGRLAAAPAPGGGDVQDFVDPDHGGRVRLLRRDNGHEHNLYYYRNPWNADSTRLLVIHSNLQQRDWRLALHDGDGRYLQELFSVDRYDWRVVWDRHDPNLFYTWRGATLQAFDIRTGVAKRLKNFAPLTLKPSGPSINQAGDRILVITSDNVFRSYRLPDMAEERTFSVPLANNETVSWDKPAYTGCENRIHVAVRSSIAEKSELRVYDDNGRLVHAYKGIGAGGHYDFSRDGRLAYFRMPWMPHPDGGTDLEIRVVEGDGGNDRVVYRATREAAAYVHNLHLSWPDGVGDWFVAALFPKAGRLPTVYKKPLDEIIQVHVDGTSRVLARTHTAYSVAGDKGSTGDMFWAQPLASPSANGSRLLFNTNRAGTIDVGIVYVNGQPASEQETGTTADPSSKR